MPRESKKHWYRNFIRSKWSFPAILFVLVILLTCLRISGSSIGSYNLFLYGKDYKDPDLIFGRPQLIRSDEWHINTPLTVGQVAAGMPAVNPNIGGGQDMTLITDVPYRAFSAVFKPQNWSFFVLPLEHAFAFKWWFIGFVLVCGCYLLLTELLPGRFVLCGLLSLGLWASPFVQWWYQTATLLPLAYSFIILYCLLLLEKHSARLPRVILGGLISYFGIAFALIFYPPFQIPCAIVAGTFYLGHVLGRKASLKEKIRAVALPGLCMVIALLGVILFFRAHSAVLSAIMNTVYPGHRLVESGGYSTVHLLSGFLDYQLQSLAAATHAWANQSEAASFIFVWPFLLLPTFLLIRNNRDNQKPWALIAVSTLMIFFTIRMLVSLPPVIGKLTLLASVPHNRLIIGFGMLGLLQLGLLARHIKPQTFSVVARLGMTLTACAVQLIILWRVSSTYPQFVQSTFIGLVAIALVSLVVFLVVSGRHTTGALVLLVLSGASIFYINPLYRGLGPITTSPVTQAIQAQDHETPGGWAIVDYNNFMNHPMAAGVTNYSGTMPSPHLSQWEKLDTDKKYMNVYNRFALVLMQSNLDAPFVTTKQDQFSVKFDPCGSFFQNEITNVISVHKLSSPCMTLTRSINYPQVSFYFYNLHPQNR